MAEKTNRVTVEIFGENYALKGNVEPEQVVQLAAILDKRMKKIARSNPKLPPIKVAVLAALHIVDEYLKLEEDYIALIDEMKK
ncbi:MAG TPA: cell division protein ZapA [Methylomusa anaerophila]|uniref:Cell division protein ZapA n=1 Tax=Methylomusa anaerophila TaxID=1930071 RepID=A0A348AP42_9FIRM|nr:cell division protein ZapA [Methylomusa anaerophila]BBB92840.1 cell division protein ZapA [Methylomusa anaerophila]HML87320.1 cell division protein ZapA [Methylomusa anaerophila]